MAAIPDTTATEEPGTAPIMERKEPEDASYNPNLAFPAQCMLVGEDSDHFKCVKCNGIPRQGYELDCGHGACCQTCKDEVSCSQEASCTGVTDRMGAKDRKTIINLGAKCLRFEAGCPWVGTLKIWDLHVRDECEYRHMQCERCPERFRICERGAHEPLCKFMTCDLAKFEMNCSGERMTVEEHGKHREEAYLGHIDVVAEAFATAKRNLEDRITQLNDQNRCLQEEVDKMRQEAEERESKISHLEQDMNGVFETMQEMANRLHDCEFLVGIVDSPAEVMPVAEDGEPEESEAKPEIESV